MRDRSIYTLWRQVLEYFDAFLIGLTATPAKHTYAFFNQNVVMEYTHEEAVADGVNVGFDVYRIRTRISDAGSTIEASPLPIVGRRNRLTRAQRWTRLDQDFTYDAAALDRSVVAKDQIRLIVRTFRDRLFTEIFPGRTEVPKTLIFAKDDSHAEDIVEAVREEFGAGNDFCQKITYKTTGKKPSDLIQEFRIGFNPRIAVTVDMIATGTDVKPIEIVMFMRSVKSRVLFEQMKGRGVRTIDPNELNRVTPDTRAKTHFVVVDCVGLTDTELFDSYPLERNKSVSLASLLEQAALGTHDEDVYSSLVGRLARLRRELNGEEDARLAQALGGKPIGDIVHDLVQALEPDRQIEVARKDFGLAQDQEPTAEQVEKAKVKLLHLAAAPLASNPGGRKLILEIKQQHEQIIDVVSQDELLEAGASPEAKEKARALVRSFEQYLAEHRDEIAALQFFYSVPHRQRLRFEDVEALAQAIGSPPRSWTPERLWRAYELLEGDKVRGASAKRLLCDVVSLVRFALHQDEELVPFLERVKERFRTWLQQQENAGRSFTPQQLAWLEMMRDHIATSAVIEIDDFDFVPFNQQGGLSRARQVFGEEELGKVMQELNEVLAA